MIVRESKWSRPGPRGIGPTRRRSTCEKDRTRAEMELERYVVSVIVLESENGNKGTLAASEESKAKEKVRQIEKEAMYTGRV